MTEVPKRKAVRRRGRPSGERLLSLDQIVDAAIGLLDARGPAGLSMRNLAGTLGVHNNALYTYVPDRAALESAIVERLLAEADPATLNRPRRPWRARITTFAHAVRAVLRRHPGAMTMFMTAPMTGPVALTVGEGLLGCYIDAGLRPEQASRAAYTTIVYVLGFAALDIAETDSRPPLLADHDRARQRRARFDTIDHERYPLTADTVATMATWVTRDAFDWGLRALLDGIARQGAGASTRTRPTRR